MKCKSTTLISLNYNNNHIFKLKIRASTQFGAKGSVQRGKFRAKIPDVSKLTKLEDQIRANVL